MCWWVCIVGVCLREGSGNEALLKFCPAAKNANNERESSPFFLPG